MNNALEEDQKQRRDRPLKTIYVIEVPIGFKPHVWLKTVKNWVKL